MTTAVPSDLPPAADLTPAGQIAKLRHGDPGERYYAAWWLGRMRIPEGIPALIEALADETDRTTQGGYPLRRNAARALGKVASPAGIPGSERGFTLLRWPSGGSSSPGAGGDRPSQ
jgi:phycocyanobilin lyase subunit alpha